MFLFYTNPILIAAAVLPAIFLLVHVYRADKLEKEPAPLLISLVLYGIAATFIALVLERAGSFLLGLWFEEGSVAYNAIMYFGIVAFSEEGAKYFLLRRRTWHSAAFNCQFDGVVYAVFVALGFALWENISYVLMYGLSTALVRVVRPCQAAARTGERRRVQALPCARPAAACPPARLLRLHRLHRVGPLRLAVRSLRGDPVRARLHPCQAPGQTRPLHQQLRRGISVKNRAKNPLP